MADSNLSLVLYGKCNLALEERPVLEPGPGQVQVSMRRVGICGSDVHLWQTGQIGPFILKDTPVVLGHEGSALVTKVGPGVTSLQVGDRVAIEPAIPCRLCHYCKDGRYNLCLNIKGLALPGVDGHITRTFVHDADFCHKLSDNVSFEEGAIMEPLSVCVHATSRAQIGMGDVVVIIGAGPIGILNMLVCKARGVRSTCLTDQERLDFAKTLGADFVINVKGQQPEQVVEEMKKLLTSPVDVSIECSGTQSGVYTALQVTRPGGKMVAVGMSSLEMKLPLSEAIVKEIDIITSFRYCNSFPKAIDLVATQKVDVTPLITHKFPLIESIKAFETARAGKGIKIIIDCEKH